MHGRPERQGDAHQIFGGMARVDIIAQGIIAAYKEIDIKVACRRPLVGTNVEEGERLLAESKIPLTPSARFGRSSEEGCGAAAGK